MSKISNMKISARDHLSDMLFSITILIILFSTPSKTDHLYTLCNIVHGNYTIGSSFANKLESLLRSLPSNTSWTGYNNVVSPGEGNEPPIIASALCRGDVNSTLCRTCLENASDQIFNQCKAIEAFIWYDLCQVYYSTQYLASRYLYIGKCPKWNLKQRKVADADHFSDALSILMKNLTKEATFNSSHGKRFATGEILVSQGQSIYGLVQCTGDINLPDCSSCLGSALEDLRDCCEFRQAGILLSRDCNVRYGVSCFYNSSTYFLTLAASSSKGTSQKTWIACLSIAILAIFVMVLVVRWLRRRSKVQDDEQRSQMVLLKELATPKGVAITQQGELVTSDELPIIDLTTIREATDDFSDLHKIGQGGFGAVYKGVLLDGMQVAIKRLSRRSWQGIEEFKNEVILMARLQHRNLVRLLGCGMEGDERLLIYEFMPNKSLNFFIFDSEKRAELGWQMLHNVIVGIARGLVYLHEDSRLKIIHRDLKPSNILLDEKMVAKISDFGIARIFSQNQNIANTIRVVGTYGYMAPEYAMEGIFSVKSDVFSYGVILLEIISGRRNTNSEQGKTLLSYAWQLWQDRNELEFVESTLKETSPSQVVRCMHIGLLCVQEDPADRPTMSSIVALLGNNSIELPEPKQPASFAFRPEPVELSPTLDPSVNQVTMSTMSPR